MQNPYFSTVKSNQQSDRNSSIKYDLKDKYASTAIKREGSTNENNTGIFTNQPLSKHQSVAKDNPIFQGQNQLSVNPSRPGNQSSKRIFSGNNSNITSPHLDFISDMIPSQNQSFLNSQNPINQNHSHNNSFITNNNSVRNPPPNSNQRTIFGGDSIRQGNGSFMQQSVLNTTTQPQNYHSVAQQKSFHQQEDARIFSSDQLLVKTERTIEQMRENSNILQTIVERRRKIFYDYDSCLDKIDIQKKRLNQCSKNDSKIFFQQKTSHELLLFKDKKQDLVKIKEECFELIAYYQKEKSKGQYSNSILKTATIHEQMYQQEGFEFESMYLRIQDQYSSKISLLEGLVENYKKHFKFDKTSEKFIEKQQQLSVQMKEIDNEDFLFGNLNLLIDDFLITLKALVEELEENVEFNEILLSSYQESFNYVQQILFYRFEKLPELDAKIKNNIRGNILQCLQYLRNRPQQANAFMQQAQKESSDIREALKKLKKSAKQTHSSQNSMFFVYLRTKQITKLIDTINETQVKNLDDLDRLITYISQGQMSNDELYCQNIISNTKQLVLTLHGQQSPDQNKIMLQKTQIQLSLLQEFQIKLQKLSQQPEFHLIGVSIQQMTSALTSSIQEITAEQQKIFPLIKYENETREFRQKKQEIMTTLDKAKEMIQIYKQNPQLTMKIDDNQKQFQSVLQLNIKLQQYQKLLNQLLMFFQNSRQIPNSPFDAQTINSHSQEIHQLLSSVDYHKANIHLISSIQEASFNISSNNLAFFDFQIDLEKNKLQSNLAACNNQINKSSQTLANLRIELNKPNQNNRVEQILIKQLVTMEQVLASTSNILVFWMKSGDEVTQKVISLRKNFGNYQNSVIDQQLYDIIQDNLDELDSMIKNSLAPNLDIQNILQQNVKLYTECLVRYALSLERKHLNPYSAGNLINWLDKNYQNALSSISYLFDMDDLIRYQQGNEDDEIGIQLKLLRSRLTEQLQSQQSLSQLFNQQSIIANIKLDLILQIILKDSILYDHRTFEELINIGKEFNYYVRQCFEIRRIIEEKYKNTFSLNMNQQDLELFLRTVNKYLKAVQFNYNRQEFIDKKGLFSEEMKRSVQLAADKNQNMVLSIIMLDRDSLQVISQIQGYLQSYVRLKPFLNLDGFESVQQQQIIFDDLFGSKNNYNLFQQLQELKQSVDILLDGHILEIIRQTYYREKEIVDRIKLDRKIGLFECIFDCSVMKELRSNKDLIKWKEIIQKTINYLSKDLTNSSQASQIHEDFSRINQLNNKQQIFVNKFINSQSLK